MNVLSIILKKKKALWMMIRLKNTLTKWFLLIYAIIKKDIIKI